jgi:putative transcriptional regulator
MNTAFLLLCSLFPLTNAFVSRMPHQRTSLAFHQAREPTDEGEIDLSGRDWRDFRAKLVLGESNHAIMIQEQEQDDDEDCIPESGDCDLDGIGNLYTTDGVRSTISLLEGMTPLDPSQWAYESGSIIEQGAVILGGVEQDFGFGLRQQYFHKAAILVLDHQESTFTKGIILNRPTDLLLDDDVNPGAKWPVWFGGDVQGLDSENPDIVCLHSLKHERAVEGSVPVMKDIQWTSFESAKQLVKEGIATPEDFWVFCGYAGWGPSQLMGELDRKSWYTVATDSWG